MTSLAHATVGAGPDVVFLHPIGLDGRSWSKVARRLEGRFTCHLVDLPGHGGSPALAGAPGLDDYADQVEALLTGLGMRRFAIVGLSFGGMIAQVLGARRIDGLAALVLCGCAFTFPEAVRSTIAARGTKALAGGMGAVVDETLERWFSADFLASGDAAPVVESLLADDPRDWAAAWNAIAALDMELKLGAIRAPTLCIAGEKDAAASPALGQALADHIAGASFAMIPEAPHMMHWENADALAEALSAFLARHS